MRIDNLGDNVRGSFFVISLMHIMTLVSAVATTLLYNLCLEMEKKAEVRRKKPSGVVESINKED